MKQARAADRWNIRRAISGGRSIHAPSDIYVYDARDGSTRQITKTDDAETNPRFTLDEKRVAFTRGNNLYVVALDNGATEEMTDIRPPGTPPPDEEKGTASQEALKKDPQELFDAIRERAAEREEQEARRKREHPRKPFILQNGPDCGGPQPHPDEKYVVASIREAASGAKHTTVPSFVTESGYTEDIPSYEKVGGQPPPMRLAILSVGDGRSEEGGSRPTRHR